MDNESGGKPRQHATAPTRHRHQRDWRQDPPSCPYHTAPDCWGKARLVDGLELYRPEHHASRLQYWACVPCGAWCGVHGNSPRKAPLGSLADSKLRQARIRVHLLLEPLWHGTSTPRADVYARLAAAMGIESRRCHVAFFRDEDCARALAILQGELQRLTLESDR